VALPTPVQRQREVVCLPAAGHQVILGTAGSGKTTMAILRSAYLSHHELPEHGPTLLLTYNKALCAYIRTLAAAELENVTVEHYHKFARGYLKARGKMRNNAIIRGSARDHVIGIAIKAVAAKHGANTFFDRPLNFFSSEIGWLAKHGIISPQDYESQNRTGRAEARLERRMRKIMWEIYEAYLAERSKAGYDYDWDDLSAAVIRELDGDKGPRRYRHIVIDEGQDLSPEMIRSLTKAVPTNGSITFFGDVAQQIYGHRMSWRSAGLAPHRVWQFTENYRNSREIAALGLAISRMPYYAGVPDMVAPTAPVAAGPKPTLVHVQDGKSEANFAVTQATRLSRTQSVAVLIRTVRQLDEIRRLLPPGTINLRNESAQWVAGPRLFVGTYHSAKGLEFDAVILPYLSDSWFPDPQTIRDFGSNEAQANDGRLLYVGVTRARTALILTYSGTICSLLPTDSGLYATVRL
jgi:superfamily I DNA/RNA helicase